MSPSDVCDDCRFRFLKITGKPRKPSTITGIECAFHRDSTQNLNFHCWQKNERGVRLIENYLEIIFSIFFFRNFFFEIFFRFFFWACTIFWPPKIAHRIRSARIHGFLAQEICTGQSDLGTNTYSFNIYKYRSHHWLIFGRVVSLGNQRSH